MLIGLTGKKQSGKSTISKHLQEQYGFKELNFADSLKKALKEILDLTDEQLDGEDKEKLISGYNCTPREVMQWFGTDIMRNKISKRFPSIHSVWVKNVERKLIELLKQNQDVVISDIRFKNEADLIVKYGGYIIYVESDNNIEDLHESENNKIEYNYKIVNRKEFYNTNYLSKDIHNIINLIKGNYEELNFMI